MENQEMEQKVVRAHQPDVVLQNLRLAGPRARAWAFLLDSVIFTLAWGLIGVPVLLLIYGTEYLDHAAGFFGQSSQLTYGAWDLLITWLLPLVVAYGFWVLHGATPGKMATSIRIVDARSGLPASPLQLAVRLVGHLVSMMFMGIGFLWIFFDKRRQGLHDKLARTLVIDTWQPVKDRASDKGQPAMAATDPSMSVSLTPDSSSTSPPWLTTVRMALFQFGASLLLLVVLASAIRRHVLRAEILERSQQSFMTLREAGLYPGWLEVAFFHSLTLATLLAAVLGLSLVWAAKQHHEARLLALLLGFYFFCGCVMRLLGVEPGLASQMDKLSQWLALAAILRFAVVFPRPLVKGALSRGRSPEHWGAIRRSWWWCRTLIRSHRPQPVAGRGARGLLLSPSLVWGGAILAALMFQIIPDLSEAAVIITTLLITGLLIVAADMLWTNITLSSRADRNRGLWVAYGVMLAVLIPIMIGVVAIAASTTAALAGVEDVGDMTEAAGMFSALISIYISPLVLTLALAFGMFYKGEISPGFAIRKTTLYAALGMIGMLVFAGVEHLLSSQLERFLPLSGAASGFISAMLGAGSIGLFRSKLRGHTDALFKKLLPDPDDVDPLAAGESAPDSP